MSAEFKPSCLVFHRSDFVIDTAKSISEMLHFTEEIFEPFIVFFLPLLGGLPMARLILLPSHKFDERYLLKSNKNQERLRRHDCIKSISCVYDLNTVHDCCKLTGLSRSNPKLTSRWTSLAGYKTGFKSSVTETGSTGWVLQYSPWITPDGK